MKVCAVRGFTAKPCSVQPALSAVAATAIWLCVAGAVVARDWTYLRGPNFNGASSETGLIESWDPRGGEDGNVAWRRDDLGGRSTPVVMNGRLYVIVRADPATPVEGERVVCLDAKTGETLWEYKFNVYLSDVPDTRVGWSSVACDPETNRVYALGVCGLFHCLDAATGDVVWRIPLHEQFGLLSTYGGRTNFPIICDDLVIVSAVMIGWGEFAKPAHRFIGFDKRTGDVAWINGTRPLPYDTTYSAPALAVIDGQKTLVFGSGDGSIHGLQPRTGKQIWTYRISRRGVNSSPLVVGDTVFAGHSDENLQGAAMGAVAAINLAGQSGDITQSGRVWQVQEIMAGRTAPLKIGNRLWVFDERAKLHVLDIETGEPIVRRISLGTAMRANPLYADGRVYAFTANGRWSILEPDEQAGAKVLKRGRIRSEEVLASPICANGRIYLPTTGALYCLFDPTKQPGRGREVELVAEPEVDADSEPAHLQLVPADVLMKPGETRSFTARLFNARGQFLRTAKAEFEVDGAGRVNEAGEYTAAGDHAAAYLTATADGVAGVARIRVAPPLPWRFDFSDVAIDAAANVGEPPISWIGARYRHVVREVDGDNVMVKVTTIPKGTRSRSWMGPSSLSNYTIQADVRGASVDGKMPDIGLIAQGYTLDLQGADQKLQVRTWVTQQRMAKTIDFAWRPDTWYTMKLQASLDGKQAVVRGKVWLRGEQEPDEWTVVARDNSPNRAGSPGLFGNANDAEIFIDNIRVSGNSD